MRSDSRDGMGNVSARSPSAANTSAGSGTGISSAQEILTEPEKWQEALAACEQELRRALEHGFTADELEEARANLVNAYEQAAKRAPSRRSSALASQLVRAINREAVFSSPETDLEIARKAAGEITPEACHEAFRDFWQDAGIHIVLTAKEKPEGAEEQLAGIAYDDNGLVAAIAQDIDNGDVLMLAWMNAEAQVNKGFLRLVGEADHLAK